MTGDTVTLGVLQGLVEESEVVVDSAGLPQCDTSYTISLSTRYITRTGAVATNKDSIQMFVACQALVGSVLGGGQLIWKQGAICVHSSASSVESVPSHRVCMPTSTPGGIATQTPSS